MGEGDEAAPTSNAFDGRCIIYSIQVSNFCDPRPLSVELRGGKMLRPSLTTLKFCGVSANNSHPNVHQASSAFPLVSVETSEEHSTMASKLVVRPSPSMKKFLLDCGKKSFSDSALGMKTEGLTSRR